MTSNIGASEIARNTPLGFAVSDDETGITYDDMKTRITGELKKVFRPEFLNRIDEVIVFHKLTKDEIKEIVDLLLRRIRESMADRELQLELSEPAKDMLVDKGWDPSMGARPLRRAIQRYVEDPLADFVLRSQVPSGSTVMVDWPVAEDGGGASREAEVKLTVIEPAPKPHAGRRSVPAGRRGEGGRSRRARDEPHRDRRAGPRRVAHSTRLPAADEPVAASRWRGRVARAARLLRSIDIWKRGCRRARARAVSAASSAVPTPRRCQPSTTSIATSASVEIVEADVAGDPDRRARRWREGDQRLVVPVVDVEQPAELTGASSCLGMKIALVAGLDAQPGPKVNATARRSDATSSRIVIAGISRPP